MAAVTLIGMDMHLAGGLFTDRSVDALGHEAQLTEARTMGFTILVFAQLFNALASRSSRQSAFVGLFSNKWLWGAIALSIVLQLLVIYVPFLNGPFGTTPLSPLAWVECICLAAFVAHRVRDLQGHHARHRQGARQGAEPLSPGFPPRPDGLMA